MVGATSARQRERLPGRRGLLVRHPLGRSDGRPPWLPFGTHVTVTNIATGESVVVVINDRGPFGGRIIDLSDEAFAVLAPLGQGVMQVRLTW